MIIVVSRLTVVNWPTVALAVVLLIPGLLPGAEDDPQKKDRVRAKEPTVVTVEGQADRVNEDRSTPDKSLPAKIGSGIKTGVTGAARAIVGFGGWLLNADDDIPSERERREAGQQRGRTK
jgi:hypothetical protein